MFPHGYVRVAGERIDAVGPMEELVEDRADEVIDCGGMVATPGLINLHNHHWGSLFKNTGDGLLLEPWLDQVTIPLLMQLTPETLRAAAYLGAIEALRTGTTCQLNHVVNVNDAESFAAICEPYPEVGVRQVDHQGAAPDSRPAVLERLPGHEARAGPGRRARPR